MLIQKKSVVMQDQHQIIGMRTEGDNLIVRHAQNVEPMMRMAKHSRDNFDKSFTTDRMAWPVAEVPTFIFRQFQNKETGEVDWKRFNQWIESEGHCFKTS